MLVQLCDGEIEWFDGAVGPRKHYSTFHYGQDVSRERIDIRAGRKIRLNLLQAGADGSDPPFEVLGDEVVGGTIFWVDLQG